MRCQLVVFLVITFVLIFGWAIEIVKILMNPYFGYEYGLYYGVLIIPALVGAILIQVTICSKDTHKARRLAPWGFLLVAISSFLIGTWICVYIFYIYEEPYVKFPRTATRYDYDDYYQEGPEDSKGTKRDHYRISKSTYVLWSSLFDFINGGLFLCLFFFMKIWVDENEERRNALDEPDDDYSMRA